MTWRPISTAPTDGTLVLVYAPPADPAKWGDILPDPTVALARYHPDAGWCICEIREVTHWQPFEAPGDAT